jgi:arylsulfatase A-like enzyme
MWRYTFGLHEYTPEELALTAATYDAALSELDELFAGLLDVLRADGRLDQTIVVLTSDHGEHLGEHHRLDHQYSVYEPILRVPLAIAAPRQLPPGRERRPVSTADLFPTILELVGQPVPAHAPGYLESLLRPAERRVRLASYTAPLPAPLRTMQRLHPAFDPRPWQRTLAALVESPLKYIRASDGAQELYDVVADPGETQDLAASRPDVVARLATRLDAEVTALARPLPTQPAAVLSAAERQRLEALGYVDAGETDPAP